MVCLSPPRRTAGEAEPMWLCGSTPAGQVCQRADCVNASAFEFKLTPRLEGFATIGLLVCVNSMAALCLNDALDVFAEKINQALPANQQKEGPFLAGLHQFLVQKCEV